MPTVSQMKPLLIGMRSSRHAWSGSQGAIGGLASSERFSTSRVALLSSRTCSHMWSQYRWKAGQSAGRSRIGMPYIEYHRRPSTQT
jgi:hypothetical protein